MNEKRNTVYKVNNRLTKGGYKKNRKTNNHTGEDNKIAFKEVIFFSLSLCECFA